MNMAEGQAPTGHDTTPEEKLDRLSRKPGVKASIIIDRQTGSILKTSGQLSVLTTAKSRTVTTPSTGTFPNEAAAPTASASASTQTAATTTTDDEAGSQGVEDFAQMIWTFVNGSGQFIQDLDSEDELRLLRLRTKKHEIVIVQDPKYLLTVIHDTHQA